MAAPLGLRRPRAPTTRERLTPFIAEATLIACLLANISPAVHGRAPRHRVSAAAGGTALVWTLLIVPLRDTVQNGDAMDWLTDQEVEHLTRKAQHAAQRRVLMSWGILFVARPDGSLVVHRRAVERVLGAEATVAVPQGSGLRWSRQA